MPTKTINSVLCVAEECQVKSLSLRYLEYALGERSANITLIHCRRKGKNYRGTFIPLAVGGMGHDVSDREKGKGV